MKTIKPGSAGMAQGKTPSESLPKAEPVGKHEQSTVTKTPALPVISRTNEKKASDTELSARSSAKNLDGLIENSHTAQAEYLLARPFTPTEKNEVIDLFITSISPEELKKLSQDPLLKQTTSKAKNMPVTGEQGNTTNPLKASIKEALTYSDTPLADFP